MAVRNKAKKESSAFTAASESLKIVKIKSAGRMHKYALVEIQWGGEMWCYAHYCNIE